VIAGFCILGALIGASLINRNILTEAQRRAKTAESAGMVIVAAAVFVLAAGFFFSRRLTGSPRQLAKAADLIAPGKTRQKGSRARPQR
jgi:hypothetical protein